MFTALCSVSSVVLALSPLAPPQGKGKLQPPPGLVLIDGGSTKIGTPVKEAEEFGKANPSMFPAIARETPQHDMRLDDFFLMVTEVTNEQYMAFVKATGARPPEHWAEKIIDAASAEYVTKQGEEKAKAKAEGRPAPDFPKFDRAHWWRSNWEGKPFAVPAGDETKPVVYVDYKDAQAYARWAGLRLMSEFEFQRAGRGKTDNVYPWGTDGNDKTRAVTQEIKVGGRELRPAKPFKVASLQGGKTAQGVYDLSGNVWEWTASPWSPFPGHKDLTITVGAGKQERKIPGMASWDANQRVVVSGCFQVPMFAARLTYRRGEERFQSTDSLGFRCAASVTPGLDLAGIVMRDDVPLESRPLGAQFDAARVVAADRWSSTAGTATTVLEEGAPAVPVPSYAVIDGYDYLMFVPAIEIDTVSIKGLGDMSRENGPIPLGVFSTTKPVLQPALDKGTYIVSYRAAGALATPVEAGAKGDKAAKGDKQGSLLPQDGADKKQDAPAGPKIAEFKAPEGYDPKVDALIFYTPAGEPKGWIPAPNLDCVKPVQPKVVIADGKRAYVVEKPGGMRETKHEDATIASLTVNSYVRISDKSLAFTLPLYFKQGELGADWRTR
ncbi:MAG: SUMF1/EgtB/PvdO family nonheme iron enzyme [Planctomycetes bacterium]|nr:SUMF1/EgtB/PvdO family nonheme iron enzyme [Planctomycetota bacterium]